MKEKIVGIIGGMGPDATVDLFQKILRATPAKTDQEHLRIIIDCNSKIPDRTAHIMRGEENPGPYLVSSAKLLEKAGVDVMVMPCNAAHVGTMRSRRVLGFRCVHHEGCRGICS